VSPEAARPEDDVLPLVTSTDVPPPARPRRRSLVPVLAIGGLAAAAGVLVLQQRETPPPRVRTAAVDSAVATPRPDSIATAAVAADTASAAADTGAIAASDTALIADGPAADTAQVVARDTTALIPVSLIINGRARNEPITLTQGDSVRLAANVLNARRQRIQRASVAWQSSDPARIVFRRPWAVAVGAGGPVTVTATSGRLRNAVQISVASRAPVVAQAPVAAVVAAPTDAEVRAAVDEFVATLRARNFDELARRMGERAGDGSPTREFFDWVRGTRGFGVERPTTGRVGGDGPVRSVALRAQLRYTRGGLIRTAGWADAVFNIALRHGPNGWRGGSVQLARRVTP